MGVVVVEVLAESVESLRRVVATLDPSGLDGADAARLVEQFAELERLAVAGRLLVVPRVAETGAWVGDGTHRDVSAWMAATAGTTVGKARAVVETADRLVELPETSAVLRAGELSDVQVEMVAKAAEADPAAEARLLVSAATNGVKGLKDACARVEAAASTDQARRYEAARIRRSLSHRRISDVEGLIEMRGPIDVTAGVMAALEPYESELFDQARTAGRRELAQTISFDALAQMADDAAAERFETGGSRAPATVVVRVDHTAFTRGETVPGEVCEIAGVGPVPVLVARKLAADAVLKALITDGTNVLAVSHLGRSIPARLRTAVEELYPECVIEGCHVNRHLEIDHNIPVAEGGPTALWNLTRPCRYHHQQKHAHDQRIEGEGTNRKLVPAKREPGERPPPNGRREPGSPPGRRSRPKVGARHNSKAGARGRPIDTVP